MENFKKLFLLTLLFFALSPVMAQEHDEGFLAGKNMIKLTPLKAIGLINAGIEVSYERRTSRNFSTQVMASYLLPYSLMYYGLEHQSIYRASGYRLALEEKFYFRESAPKGSYFSLEVNYMYKEYGEVDEFVETNKSNSNGNIVYYYGNHYTDTISITKKTISISPKWGYQLITESSLTLDFFVGLGIRYKDVSHHNQRYPEDQLAPARHPNIYHFTNEKDRSWGISLPLNVRIGYSF